MKKIILTVLTTLISFGSLAECVPATENDFMKLGFAIAYQDKPVIAKSLEEKCISFTYDKGWERISWSESVLMTSHNFLQFKSLIKENKNFKEYLNSQYANLNTKENLLVSRMLFNFISSDAHLRIKKEIEAEKEKSFPEIKGQYQVFNKEENDKIIDYLASMYSKSFTTFLDPYNNTPITFAILTNNSDIFDRTFSQLDGNSALLKANKDGLTPLHMMFSHDVKGKDMSKLNDMVLKRINLVQLTRLMWKGVDYYQYADIYKDNNPDFYAKLKEKTRFSVVVSEEQKKLYLLKDASYLSKLVSRYEYKRDGF